MAFLDNYLSRMLYDPCEHSFRRPYDFSLDDDMFGGPTGRLYVCHIPTSTARATLSRNLSSAPETRDLVRNDPNQFQVMLNVSQFKPEELTVKTVENTIVVHGKHEEAADEHGYVSREFTRRYVLPEGVEPKDVTSSMTHDGILTLKAPIKKLEPLLPNERNVPIVMQKMALQEKRERQKQQLQKPGVGDGDMEQKGDMLGMEQKAEKEQN